jgi:cation diffusion facilitator CzcD-associated flavoprotein CzcO
LENIYPGVRCDIPANAYQSTYAQNTQWSQEYAEGKEIREYWQGVAREYDVYKYIKFERRIQRAEWNSVSAQWRLDIQDTSSGLEYTESFDVLITAVGVFNAWR